MAINVSDIGAKQFVAATFVAQAVDAGLPVVIRSIVRLAMTERELLIRLKEALEVNNKPLADALNTATLDAVLRYMETQSASFVSSERIPALLDADGPAGINPVYYAESNTVAIWHTDPTGWVGYHVLMNGVVFASGPLPEAGGNIEVNVSTLDPGTYAVRVCYTDADGNTTRLSATENVLIG